MYYCVKKILLNTTRATPVAIKINEIKEMQASTETHETKDISHLVNANKKQKIDMVLF